MDRLTAAVERRCDTGEVGAAVRLLNKAGEGLARAFKELLLQRLIDMMVRRALGDKRRKRRRREQLTPWLHGSIPLVSGCSSTGASLPSSESSSPCHRAPPYSRRRSSSSRQVPSFTSYTRVATPSTIPGSWLAQIIVPP